MKTIKFIQFNEPSTDYEFYDETMTFEANTLKVNFRVENWPFTSQSNTLDVEMDNEIDGNEMADCVQSSEDGGGSLQWLQISLNGAAAYLLNI